MPNQVVTFKKALISVSDKHNIVQFAQELHALDLTILSTGGTAKLLQQHQIPVREVFEYTTFPEIMGGRIKTLHPKILGGILARRDQDQEVMHEHGIKPIDLVVVNLYPFAKTIANPQHTLTDAIENIDIGGPTMVRAAAKNYHYVAVVVDPNDYEKIIAELRATKTLSEETRFHLAQKAFKHTAHYDNRIAAYLNQPSQELPDLLECTYQKKQNLRYGENPHQRAAFYISNEPDKGTVAGAKQIQGKALSFNNIADADCALQCVKNFTEPACVIVKHANPCGVAIGGSLKKAYELAFATDPHSAFGGILAFNDIIDADLINDIISKQFAEVIVAPALTDQAQKKAQDKPNIRILITDFWPAEDRNYLDFRSIQSGLLVQDGDIKKITAEDLQVVTKRQPTVKEITDLLFAWIVAKSVKSNAIVYAKDQRTIGIGAGQMSRVDSTKIAQFKAKASNLSVTGSVIASDAFFPFRDNIDTAEEAGVTAIIQPGGSIRDKEIIDAANEYNMAMVFTGIRHFRH